MKLFFICLTVLILAVNSYSHCGGCRVNDNKQNHSHSTTNENSNYQECSDKSKKYQTLDLSQKYEGSSNEFDDLMIKYKQEIEKINKKYEKKFKKLEN